MKQLEVKVLLKPLVSGRAGSNCVTVSRWGKLLALAIAT